MPPDSNRQQGPFICDRQYETPILLDNSTAMPHALTFHKSSESIQQPVYIRYVALGDSYSAGMGASRAAYSSCLQRSPASWPSSIASWLQSDGELQDNVWVHAACSVYTTGMTMRDPQCKLPATEAYEVAILA